MITLAITGAFLTGCAEKQPAENPMQLANPASTYCIKQGGKLEIVKDPSGGQKGICHLPDGTSIEEWELFRRDNPG